MTKVIKYDLAMPVTVRKHPIDTDKLRSFLRNAKQTSKRTNRQIAEIVSRPITEVEHWFRTDDCFSIPDAEIWHTLKGALNIESTEFDLAVTEFEEKPGVFEKANRFYDIDGIAPALTVASADEKIIISDFTAKGDDDLTKQTNEVTYEKTPFTYVSLFSGIGGFETALNRLGGTCVLASEIDKFANQSYEALYGHPTAGDITKIQAEDVPDHEILVGGFPCQAFSVAGKRGGFDDARGTLFFEVARIAKTKQPRAILLENVKGLVGHDGGKTLDTIVKTLNDIGYTVDFNVLNSKYFGVPQNRERIFIVALRDDVAIAEPWNIEGTNVVAKGKRRLSEYEGIKTFNFDWPSQDNVTTRLRDVLEPTVDERYYLSEEKTAKLVAQLEDKSVKNEDPYVVHNIYGGFKEDKPRVFKDESPTIRTPAGGGHLPSVYEPAKYRIRKLTPLEAFRLQGFSDEQHKTLVKAGLSDSQRYKQAGNAVSVPVIEAIGVKLLAQLSGTRISHRR